MVKPLSAVIFDLDGTLIDSSDGVVAAVNYSLRRMGEQEQPADKIKAFIGYPLATMYPSFSRAPIDELYSHFQHKARETVVSSTVALPDTGQVLDELRQSGYRLAIASTKIREHIDGIIQKLGWSDYIEVCVGGDEVDAQKPAPDAFLKALELLGCAPQDAIVVGDTENDILAAKAVPMRVVAVQSPYGDNSRIREAGPEYFIERLADLPVLITRLIEKGGRSS